MTQAMGHELRRYLNINGQERLLKLLPPPMPNPLPIGPTAVGEWFRHEYLPARHWHNQYGDETSRAHIQSVAEQFAHWYLQEYPPALFGNSLTPHLSFQRTAALSQQGQTAITLVIVPDGLHLLDAAYLHEQIQQRTNRLTVWEDGVAFAPLPTITEICKRALLTGSPPYLALGEPHLGEVVKDSDSPAKAIKIAQEGQLIFWRVTDPDQTYHYHNNSDNLRQEVNGRLMGLAAKIADLVENLPPEIPLRLIITSDHGRLLANSPRTLPVPEGMTSHGRAAYGNSNHAFDEQGFFIADGLVYLHADRFGLVQNAALAFTEETFQTNDGRTGQEKYPHGGLYPEEVVVPWLELMRDAALPAVTATLTGMGDVGQQGQLTLTLLNPADIELTATELVWVINGREHPRPFNLTIAPLSEISYSILWPNWPTKPEVQQTRAQLTLHLPNGYAFTTAISVGTIEANEMYQRDNILGDLEL